MNDATLAPPGEPVGLTLSITPWPHNDSGSYNVTRHVVCRVDRDAQTLALGYDDPAGTVAPLTQLEQLMRAAAGLISRTEYARLTLGFSGVVLDAAQLREALDEWTQEAVPVHSLVAFDFATRGDPPGAKSVGLAALVGQEVVAWPPDESLRMVCARMVVRLAHDMLLNGPILAEAVYPAPDAPRGLVTLVPREVPEPVVQIRF